MMIIASDDFGKIEVPDHLMSCIRQILAAVKKHPEYAVFIVNFFNDNLKEEFNYAMNKRRSDIEKLRTMENRRRTDEIRKRKEELQTMFKKSVPMVQTLKAGSFVNENDEVVKTVMTKRDKSGNIVTYDNQYKLNRKKKNKRMKVKRCKCK